MTYKSTYNPAKFNSRSKAILEFFGQFQQNPMPITLALKQYFRKHPQMGSRDRKEFTQGMFALLRLEPLLPKPLNGYSIQLALHWTHQTDASSWWANTDDVFEPFPIEQQHLLMPCSHAVSSEITKAGFFAQLLHQKPVWLRLKNLKNSDVKAFLNEHNIPFKQADDLPNAIALPANNNINQSKPAELGWFEVQDWSSQKAIAYLSSYFNGDCWDVCAASGGKTLALLDLMPQLRLFASDVRPNILLSLNKRLQKAAQKNIQVALFDAANFQSALPPTWPKAFDTILIDAPCSGSGTWGRNPDAKIGFNQQKLWQLQALQQQIVAQTAKYLKVGKNLVYLTCSVFADENEAQQEFIEKLGFNCTFKHYFMHPHWQSDILFAAVYTKV